MQATSNEQPLGVVVAWLDAMRRGEPESAADYFRADVRWRGLPDDALCNSRDEVLEMLQRTQPPRADALELIVGDGTVVLGVRSADLREIGDVPLAGQLYNVFEIRDGAIASVKDFARREDALRAAGADEPNWT
jgi:limonene-1,2-epoxide hydrolase